MEYDLYRQLKAVAAIQGETLTAIREKFNALRNEADEKSMTQSNFQRSLAEGSFKYRDLLRLLSVVDCDIVAGKLVQNENAERR